jgi:hypothetical protein
MQLSSVFRFAITLTLFLAADFTSVRAQSTAQAPLQKADDNDVEVSTFYQGEFERPTYSFWGPRLPCGIDLNGWAMQRCGGRRWIYKPVTNAESGNRCGYRGFALVCFNR